MKADYNEMNTYVKPDCEVLQVQVLQLIASSEQTSSSSGTENLEEENFGW